jgi:hypothetical protein
VRYDLCLRGDDYENGRGEVASTDELLALGRVNRWTSDAGFHRFVQSGPSRGNEGSRWEGRMWWNVLAEFYGGAEWYVVASVTESPGLPEWDSAEAFRLYDARKAKL